MRKSVVIAFSIIALIGIWFFFRPELVFVSTSLDEDFPMESAEPLLLGHFYGVAHETQGVAMIHRFPNGQRWLRLSHFETSNGPDVHVILVAALDASDSCSMSTAVSFVHPGHGAKRSRVCFARRNAHWSVKTLPSYPTPIGLYCSFETSKSSIPQRRLNG